MRAFFVGLAVASALNLVPPEEPGTPIRILGIVEDASGHPIPGAGLHVYQTDASGRYTPDKPMNESRARISGHLTTDENGRFDLRTIRPGGYPQAVRIGDRERHIPAHIHIDVTATGHAERRIQVVFADDPLLADPYWQDWVQRLRQPVASVKSEGADRVARITLSID